MKTTISLLRHRPDLARPWGAGAVSELGDRPSSADQPRASLPEAPRRRPRADGFSHYERFLYQGDQLIDET